MAWESSRPVPWKRLFVEWAIIGVVVAGISWFITDNRKAGSYLTILFAGVVYVGFGALLAKLGYARKSLRQLRAETAVVAAPAAAKSRPAPTKRTSTGPSNRPNKKKR